MLGLALAAQTSMLSVPLVAAAVALLGLARTVSWPASAATLPLLASDRALARANGLAEALDGGIGIASPLLGALAVQTVGVAGVAFCDMLLTSLCILALLWLPLTRSDATKASSVGLRAWLADATFGFRWILARPSLLRLQLFFVAINLGCSVYVVGYGAYLMSFAPTGLLGLCLAAGGTGTVAGGLWFATTGGLRRHEQGVLAGALLMSAAMLAAGLARSPTMLFAMAFVDGFTLPLINASSQTIWQARVPVDLQGRVFAIRKMIAWGLNPLSILISIPFVTRVFAPLVEEGALSHWWGNGTAGALGLMLSSCGALCLAATLPLWLTDGLRDRDPPLPQTP